MIMGNSLPTRQNERDLVITRIFDAPRELVFRAWLDPQHLAHWWGPRGFTNPLCEVDARPGGAILIHMVGPDGVVIPTKGFFHEILAPERLVFTTTNFDDAAGQPQLEILNTVTFAEYEGKTRLTLRASIITSTPAIAPQLSEMESGWNESLDRLAEVVANNHQKENNTMKTVTSKDGTTIAFDQVGEGTAVILVDGALCDRAGGPMGPVAALLAPHFSVITFDRRGRGDSGDTQPYAVEREIEDIDALVAEVGGPVYLYGISSGAVLALKATAHNPNITKLAIYEPPFIVDDTRPAIPDDYLTRLTEMIATGRRGDAIELFMVEAVSVPPEFVAPMRQQPMWPGMEALAPTLVYDSTFMKSSQLSKPLPSDLIAEMAAIQVPALVMAGGASPEWMHNGVQSATNAIPGAGHRVLEGQTHAVEAAAIAPVLVEFFQS